MPAKPSSPELVQICGATSGGTYFLLANAIAQMLNTSYPDYFKASAQATAGTPANLRLLEAGDSDFAFGQAGVASEALAGKGSFEKALTNFSSVTYVYPNVMQVAVRKGTNIKALADLKGKTFAVGATGSATELNARDLAKAAGLSYEGNKDFIAEYTSEAQSAELMKNRQADGANMIASIGSASMMDLMSSGDVEIMSIPANEMAEILKLNPAYFEYTIAKGTYPNQDYDVKTFAVANFIYCRKDLSNDVVYAFTRAIYEQTAALVNTHKIASNIKKENAVSGLTVPLHPGAEKYYKEIGAI